MLTSRFKNLFKNLRHKYRLVIYNESTFESEFSLYLSKLNVLLLFCTFFLIGMLLSLLIISFTPVKYYLPGMGEAGIRKQLREVMTESQELKRKARENELWAENIRQVLSGDIPASKLDIKEEIKSDSTK